ATTNPCGASWLRHRPVFGPRASGPAAWHTHDQSNAPVGLQTDHVVHATMNWKTLRVFETRIAMKEPRPIATKDLECRVILSGQSFDQQSNRQERVNRVSYHRSSRQKTGQEQSVTV